MKGRRSTGERTPLWVIQRQREAGEYRRHMEEQRKRRDAHPEEFIHTPETPEPAPIPEHPRRPSAPITDAQWQAMTKRAYKCISGFELLTKEASVSDISWAFGPGYLQEVQEARKFLEVASERGYCLDEMAKSQIDAAIFPRFTSVIARPSFFNHGSFSLRARVSHVKMVSPWWRRQYDRRIRAGRDIRQAERNPASEGELLKALEKIRWPAGIKCPRCDSDRVGVITSRAMWSCRCCRYQFHVLTRTVLHKSRGSIRESLGQGSEVQLAETGFQKRRHAAARLIVEADNLVKHAANLERQYSPRKVTI
jgi:transposase-like protein